MLFLDRLRFREFLHSRMPEFEAWPERSSRSPRAVIPEAANRGAAQGVGPQLPVLIRSTLLFVFDSCSSAPNHFENGPKGALVAGFAKERSRRKGLEFFSRDSMAA